jgi:4-hydroxybenzoate polyprenyltransferase
MTPTGADRGGVATWISVARPHILSIVFFATLTYGWIFTGRFYVLIPLVAVWDWFIVNLTNKATDVAEDLANGIPGAAAVAAHAKAVERLCWAMIAVGLLVGVWLVPSILPYRVAFTLIGLAYNYALIPVWRGKLAFTRFKELYFFKNFGSSVLFTLSVFLYPYVGLEAAYPGVKLLLAILFFIPLELTYEIFYDLRDVAGDRAVGVPTYPVVHGVPRAKQIIYGLIGLSALAPLVGAAAGLLAFREWCVVAACLQQALLMRVYAPGERLPTHRDAVRVTYIGAAQLASYCAWVGAGLPL